MVQETECVRAFAGPLFPVAAQWGLSFDMRLADQITKGATFLFRTKQEAEARARIGGSCFLVTKLIEEAHKLTGRNFYVPYLISCRHVVFSGGASVASVNRRDGAKPDIFEYEPTDWTPHPKGDDLAAICVHGDFLNFTHDISHISADQILTRDGVGVVDIGVGDEVFMIGRFINLQGNTVNRPAARFGSISMMQEDIWVAADHRYQESFAVEMRSRTGFSGAPVAVYRMGNQLAPVAHTNFWGLLGVNWGYILDEHGENTWLNGVVPGWKILELLEVPALKQRHEKHSKDTLDEIKRDRNATRQAFADDDKAPPATDAVVANTPTK